MCAHSVAVKVVLHVSVWEDDAWHSGLKAYLTTGIIG